MRLSILLLLMLIAAKLCAQPLFLSHLRSLEPWSQTKESFPYDILSEGLVLARSTFTKNSLRLSVHMHRMKDPGMVGREELIPNILKPAPTAVANKAIEAVSLRLYEFPPEAEKPSHFYVRGSRGDVVYSVHLYELVLKGKKGRSKAAILKVLADIIDDLTRLHDASAGLFEVLDYYTEIKTNDVYPSTTWKLVSWTTSPARTQHVIAEFIQVGMPEPEKMTIHFPAHSFSNHEATILRLITSARRTEKGLEGPIPKFECPRDPKRQRDLRYWYFAGYTSTGG